MSLTDFGDTGVAGGRKAGRFRVGALIGERSGRSDSPPANWSDRAARSAEPAPAATRPLIQRGADEVVARFEVEHTELAPVVGLIGAGRFDPALALAIHVARGEHQDAGHRLAVFIPQRSRQDRSPGQCDVHPFELGVRIDLNRERRLAGVFLTESEGDKARFADRDRVSSGDQIGEDVAAGLVGFCSAPAPNVLALQRHDRTFDRGPGVGGHHATVERGRSVECVLSGRVSRGRERLPRGRGASVTSLAERRPLRHHRDDGQARNDRPHAS